VEEAGFPFFSFAPELEQAFDEMVSSADEKVSMPVRMLRHRASMRRAMVDTIPQQLADLESILARWPADLIACEPTIWGPLLVLHESRPIQVVLLSTIAVCTLPGPDAPPFGMGIPPPHSLRSRFFARMGGWIRDLYMANMRRAASDMRQRYGLSPLKGPVIQVATDLPLYLIPSCREFDYDRKDLPSNVHYVGPLIWYPEQRPPSWLSTLPKERPWVHVAEASVAGQNPVVLRAAVKGLAGLPIQVILTTMDTREVGELGLGELPENIVGAKWINYSDLLPHLDLLVCTGGSGTISHALRMEVPLIAVPTWDHEDNAQRIVQAGAGISIPSNKCTPERLRQAVQTVLDDPSYRKNAQRMSRHMRRPGGADRAAELIEQVMA